MKSSATGWLTPSLARLSQLSRRVRLGLTMSHDAGAMLVAIWLAFSARLGLIYWPDKWTVAALWIIASGAGVATLAAMRIYNMVVRYTDNRAASRLLGGAAGATIAWFVLAFLAGIDEIPRSVGFIYFVFLFLILYFNRIGVAHLLKTYGSGGLTIRNGHSSLARGAAIIGANGASQGLAEALRGQNELQMHFFVDDNPALVGRSMLGFPIRTTDDLARAAQSGEVQRVFLSLSQTSRSERIALVSKLSALGLDVMALPSYDELMTGRFSVSDIHPINVEDLLSRESVPLIPQLIEKEIAGRSILVTGAGGSIGSEIARKLLRYRPRRMVLLDHAEFALYSIEAELRAKAGPDIELLAVIGSLLTNGLVEKVLAEQEIEVVLHAAAYKHVPLLETNEITGIRNNVLGTQILADACMAAKVERVTMISTDKAVRPISLMGASKRIAELYIQALAACPGNSTRFGIVRFGNVLDSSGSVVQQFRRQIIEGGPVTVTDEDITRFFMSIPEATELVLQANSMAKGGEVFVLDMGDAVRIADLARTMIALSGLTERTSANPDGDIAIAFVGLRPGEKLYEELFVSSEVFATAHPQIKMARERWIPLPILNQKLKRLRDCLDAHDTQRLRSLVAEFLEVDADDLASIEVEPPSRVVVRQ